MKIKIFYLLATFNFTFILSKKKEDEKCRVLALEGGGDRGAYQAGVLKGIINILPNNEVDYDVVSGISAGSLNSLGLALFPKGKEKEAVEFIVNVWEKITGKHDILAEMCPIPFIGQYIGPIYGAFFKQSIYDSTPLKNLVTKLIEGKKLERNYHFGATSLKTGKYIRFQNLTQDQIVGAVMASSAVPGICPPIHYKNDTFVDGGVSYFFDLTSAIEICLKEGYKEENIEIDLVMCTTYGISDIGNDFKTMRVLLQTFDILMDNFEYRDLITAMGIYPKAKIRYFFEPSEPISTAMPLDFDPTGIKNSIRVGEKDAHDVIKQGKGIIFRKKIEKYYEKISKQSEVLKRALDIYN